MRIVLTCMATIVSVLLFGQGFSYPVITTKGQQAKDFIPDGWMILDSAAGDLNKDNLPDAVVILQLKDSIAVVNDVENTVITQPRILLILFRNKTGNFFQLAEQSNSFILNHDMPIISDPFRDVSINAGILEIKFGIFHNMGSWYSINSSYKFRYQKQEFVLIGADYFSFHRATGDFENYSYNFLAKKRSVTKGNDEKGTTKTTWKFINVSPLKTFETFPEPFTWKVEMDVYL